MDSDFEQTVDVHVNPNIHKLEDKPKLILGHDLGAGSPCIKCNCPGLELHYWRKLCKICHCRMDDHDLILSTNPTQGKFTIGHLFDVIPEFEQKLQLSSTHQSNDSLGKQQKPYTDSTCPSTGIEEDKTVSEYTWMPTDDRVLCEKYFHSIPENERPYVGSEGAKERRRKLQYQLPNHDSNPASAKSIRTDSDREQHSKYIEIVKKKVVGVGKLIEYADNSSLLESEKTVEDSFKRTDKNANQCVRFHPKCFACGGSMKSGDVAIVTDHGLPNEVWHPNCFRCTTCDDRLVDFLYFYKDGKYYCGRHFGDSMYPRCAGCDELIFSLEYTFAEEKNWHFDHFCCFGCDKQLGGHRYMVRDDQPYCFACYMSKFAKTCSTCRNKIAPDEQRISLKDFHWHAQIQCFQCQQCRNGLLNKQFVVKNEKTFCNSDCKRQYFK